MNSIASLQGVILNESILADSIYGEHPHTIRAVCQFLEDEIKSGIECFLEQYSQFLGMDARVPSYFQIDSVIREGKVHIIEVNTQWLDGFGTGLNLARAAGYPVKSKNGLWFPTKWSCKNKNYLPEIRLAQAELSLVNGNDSYEIVPYESVSSASDPVFIYGIEKDLEAVHFPRNGYSLDSKIHLAKFSRIWMANNPSSKVIIPNMYHKDEYPWDALPESVVLKLLNKFDQSDLRKKLGRPVLFGKKSMCRKFYEDGSLIAQQMLAEVDTMSIIMCVGAIPITGYTQFRSLNERDRIINDNGSLKGPIIL